MDRQIRRTITNVTRTLSVAALRLFRPERLLLSTAATVLLQACFLLYFSPLLCIVEIGAESAPLPLVGHQIFVNTKISLRRTLSFFTRNIVFNLNPKNGYHGGSIYICDDDDEPGLPNYVAL